jgi:hypothetical protein
MRLAPVGLALCAPVLVLALAGCPAATTEPPPPPRKPEIPAAPPHALGALAAGTDDAPHPDKTPVPEGDEAMPPPGAPLAPPDAGAPTAPDPTLKAPPDAGMAL